MQNEQTILYQLAEKSPYMMGFVLVTRENRVIVIDGGRPADMPELKEYIGGRPIAAWILTHAHEDHISGFISEFEKNDGADFQIERIYYHFPPYDPDRRDVANVEYYLREIEECLPAFYAQEAKFQGKAHIVQKGDHVTIDEVTIDFLYTWHPALTSNFINDSSIVFRLTTPTRSVLFLGDLGPEGGDVLYEESRHLLKSDIVQMAHHGHMNCAMEVYAAIAPEACLWCCPEWLYEEPEVPTYLQDREKLWRMGRKRMFGTRVTRGWMDALGVKTHYVTKDGTQTILL